VLTIPYSVMSTVWLFVYFGLGIVGPHYTIALGWERRGGEERRGCVCRGRECML